jgi:hypothetical protein
MKKVDDTVNEPLLLLSAFATPSPRLSLSLQLPLCRSNSVSSIATSHVVDCGVGRKHHRVHLSVPFPSPPLDAGCE